MLGQCVANFGWLEEIIKRAIYALDRARLADDLTQTELATWLDHIGQIADDSLGTLIDQLGAAIRRHPGLRDRDAIIDRLADLRHYRNLLCHASWRPTERPGHWHPAFVAARGEINEGPMSVTDLDRVRQETVDLGAMVLQVMRATGVTGRWAGDDGPDENGPDEDGPGVIGND